MSDEEERKLWRVACEQAPDVVKWIETRLRREPSEPIPAQVVIPKFDLTYSSSIVFIPPAGIARTDVTIPLNYSLNGRYPSFNVVGMSLWIDGLEEWELKAMGLLEARITLWTTGQELRQPTGMLMVRHMDPPFRPGWLVNMRLPAASMLHLEVTNASLSRTASIRFAVHGSFEAQTG